MSTAHLLTNCPNCGAILDRDNVSCYCVNCNKTVKYATGDFAVAIKDTKAYVIVEVHDEDSITLYPLEGTVRTMLGSKESGIALMFDTKGADYANRTRSSSERRSGKDS